MSGTPGPALSHELWVKIFVNLQPEDWDSLNLSETIRWYMKVQLVSKQFREVFEQNHHFCRLVLLNRACTPRALKSLLEWLSCRGVPIEKLRLVSVGSQCQEIVLGALLSGCQRSSLTVFTGSNLSPTAVDFLADFGWLIHCHLSCLQTLDWRH